MDRELGMHHGALKSRVANKQGQRLSIAMIDWCTLRQWACSLLQEWRINHRWSVSTKYKAALPGFFICQEVENRLPDNQQLFQGISALHPSKVVSQMVRFLFQHLPFCHVLEGEQDILAQYRKFLMHIWAEEPVFDGEAPDDCTLFGTGIFNYENVLGDRPHRVSHLCFSLPLLPIASHSKGRTPGKHLIPILYQTLPLFASQSTLANVAVITSPLPLKSTGAINVAVFGILQCFAFSACPGTAEPGHTR